MNERPTEEELEDFCETGRCGCLIPQIDGDDNSGAEQSAGSDE